MLKHKSLLNLYKKAIFAPHWTKTHVRQKSTGLTNRGHHTNQLDYMVRRHLIDTIYPESPEYRENLQDILKKPCSIYAGFDPTSDSLHIGNLVTIMNLLHLRSFGHRVICVIGDATAKIGDPSGHSKDRPELNHRTIENNSDSIEEIILRIFKNHEKYFIKSSDKNSLKDIIVIRNSKWYSDKKIIDFVGETFRQVRVGSLLHKKSISDRLNSHIGMNMSEFSYQIFQAYDWLMLRNNYDCRLQLGGSDQAGNIYTGHDLIKKCTGLKDSIGLLTPLITNSKGVKLGKSTSNQGSGAKFWLKPDKTSPYQLYQYFHQTPDTDVEHYLKIYSFHDDRTIEDLIFKNLRKSGDAWHCQRKLADDVCKLIHGETGLESARRITNAFFNRNALDIAYLSDDELYQLFEDDSIIQLVHHDGLRVLDLLRRADCFKNDLEAERFVSSGALTINGTSVNNYNKLVTPDMIIGNGVTIMRLGKKNYYLFKWIK